jgi:DNA-binding HxlR family transcriptional regulator
MNHIQASKASPGARATGGGHDDHHGSSPEPAGRLRNENVVNWEHLRRRLAGVRGRWDLAVLGNLAKGVERPGELIEAINTQTREHQLSWKVLTETLRRLEDEGYVEHQEISRLPRVTKYWLTPDGHRLVKALCLLEAWYQQHETGHSCPGPHNDDDPPDLADHRATAHRSAVKQACGAPNGDAA